MLTITLMVVLALLLVTFVFLILHIRSECKAFDEWLENEEARQYGPNDMHDGEQ